MLQRVIANPDVLYLRALAADQNLNSTGVLGVQNVTSDTQISLYFGEDQRLQPVAGMHVLPIDAGGLPLLLTLRSPRGSHAALPCKTCQSSIELVTLIGRSMLQSRV